MSGNKKLEDVFGKDIQYEASRGALGFIDFGGITLAVWEMKDDFKKDDPGIIEVIDFVELPTKEIIDNWASKNDEFWDGILCKFSYDGSLTDEWEIKHCRPLSVKYDKLPYPEDLRVVKWAVKLKIQYGGGIKRYESKGAN